MNMFRWINAAALKVKGWFTPKLRVREINGDMLPKKFSRHEIIHLLDAGESWSIGFYCPCGCGDILELMLLPNIKPRWDITFDKRGWPSLHPSVWRSTGCRSHFWIKQGKIYWCD